MIGQCTARHRHHKFISCHSEIEAAVAAGKLIHTILDNIAVYKHFKKPALTKAGVLAWLASAPALDISCYAYLLLPASAGETFFAAPIRHRLQRGAFHAGRSPSRDTATSTSTTTNRLSPDPPIPTASRKESIEVSSDGVSD